MSKVAVRILKELHELAKDLPPYILAAPSPDNFRVIYFVIVRMPVMDGDEYAGAKPFEKGVYLFVLTLPTEWPFKPPTLKSLTPSGRFTVGETLCIDGTHYHTDRHNAAMSIASYIVCVSLFMQTGEHGIGSMFAPAEERERLAAESMEHNLGLDIFRELFADRIAGTHKKRQRDEDECIVAPEELEYPTEGPGPFDTQPPIAPDAPDMLLRAPPIKTPPTAVPWAFELTRTSIKPLTSAGLSESANGMLLIASAASHTPADEFIRSTHGFSDHSFLDMWKAGQHMVNLRWSYLKMWNKYVVPKMPPAEAPVFYNGKRAHLPHQQEVFPILLHMEKTPTSVRAGGALCDAPGLGKTSQIGAVMRTNRIEKTTLIVAKNSLWGHWKKELKMHGIKQAELEFCNPRASNNIPKAKMPTIGRVIIDECHEKVPRAFIEELKRYPSIIVWIVTGTPTPKTVEVFNNLFVRYGDDGIHYHTKEIGVYVPPEWFRRAVVRSSEYVPINLPPLTETNVRVSMTPAERQNYMRIERKFFLMLLNDIDFEGKKWRSIRPLFMLLLNSIFAGNFDVLAERLKDVEETDVFSPQFDRLKTNPLPPKDECKERVKLIDREKTCPVCACNLAPDASVFFWKCGHVQCKTCFNNMADERGINCGLPCDRSRLADCYQVSEILRLCNEGQPEPDAIEEEKDTKAHEEHVNVLKGVAVAETPKGSYIVDLVESAKAAHQHVAIVTRSVHVIRALKRHFKDCSALSEGTTQGQVDEILANVAEQKVEVLLVLIPRFSNGVNLQNFDHVVICEPLESPEAERQVISRFMRMGATRPTLVHRLICLGTADEYVFRAHQQNAKVTGLGVFHAIAVRHHH